MTFASKRTKGDPRTKGATLEVDEVKAARAAASRLGPLASAFLEWLYTNGARASEPGLARLSDIDLHTGMVRTVHLKNGRPPVALPLSERCRQALKAWLDVRPQFLFDPKAQKDYLFPSQSPGPCYPCRGSGTLARKKRGQEPKTGPCPHCHGTGTRWGFSRHEAYRLVRRICAEAGFPERYSFPHIFRHSAATHMLDADNSATAIQERLGHAALATTLSYMHVTKKARAAINRTFDEE